MNIVYSPPLGKMCLSNIWKKNHGEKDKYEGGSEQNTDEQAGPSKGSHMGFWSGTATVFHSKKLARFKYFNQSL